MIARAAETLLLTGEALMLKAGPLTVQARDGEVSVRNFGPDTLKFSVLPDEVEVERDKGK